MDAPFAARMLKSHDDVEQLTMLEVLGADCGEDVCDFVQRCLVMNPHGRMSAEVRLKLSFFSNEH